MEKNKKIIAGIAGAVALIAILAVCIFVFGSGKEKKITENKETTTVAETTTVPETTAQPKGISMLTGEHISEKLAEKRPVAVMYNNIINAIPHSGIDNAGIVYEAPVEGSITRLMALFENYGKLKKIGSVRSCRLYYCYFALEWDAIYCHFGQSKYALDFLKSDAIDNVGSFNAESGYYRTSDRVAPHNCFTSAKGIDSSIKRLGYRRKYKNGYKSHFSFATDNEKISLQSTKQANKVKLGYPVNKPWFEYNQKDGQYYRFQYGKKHIDDQNNKQLHCSNIIIQFVNATLYPDGKSLDMTLTGSGNGWFITNGKAEKITWKKDQKKGRTTYLDKSGKEIVLNQGKTWICMVQNEYSNDVKISK